MADDFATLIKQFGDAVSVLNSTVGKIVTVLLIFLLGLIVGRLVGRLVRKLLAEVELDRRLSLRIGYVLSIEGLIAGLVSWFFYLAGLILVLDRLGVLGFVVNSVAIILALALVVVLLLGIKDIIPNIVAGTQLHKRLALKEGRRIVIGHTKGVIEKLDWTCMELRGSKGEHLIVPYTVAMKQISTGKKKT